MRWERLGCIFVPQARAPWMQSHAANPCAEHVSGSVYRVYCSCRDAQNRSSIFCFEFDLAARKVLALSEQPIVSPGALGLFDDSGTSMGCLVDAGTQRFLYYVGWNLGVTVPWRNSIGLAVAAAGSSTFTKHSLAPLLDRCEIDPFSLSYPAVLRDGKIWRMWYGSNLTWGAGPKDMVHVIKYAESPDGLNWKRTGQVVFEASETESAFCRPCVVKHAGAYHMWYSFRGTKYRIGYARSNDGLNWQRADATGGLGPAGDGWESEEVQYAWVFAHNGRLFMLYNGNGYGKTGVGLARLQDKTLFTAETLRRRGY